MDKDLGYMELPCKYCKQMKMIATHHKEYRNGLFVVSAICDNCGKSNQKFSNKKTKNKINQIKWERT